MQGQGHQEPAQGEWKRFLPPFDNLSCQKRGNTAAEAYRITGACRFFLPTKVGTHAFPFVKEGVDGAPPLTTALWRRARAFKFCKRRYKIIVAR